MARTKKTKTTKTTSAITEGITQEADDHARRVAYYRSEREKLAALDVRMPAAHGARPLFRMRLAHPENTSLGYYLLDVIAVIQGERERDSKHTFPTYICLALRDDGTWTPTEICGYDGAAEFDEAYEVVS